MANSALTSYLEAAEKARSRTQERLDKALQLAERSIGLWEGPDSEYMKGIQSQLERERKKYLAGGTQSLVQSGLFNTTMRAGLGGRFAEEVAAPTLSQAQARQMELLSQALMQKAAILASVEDVGPDPALIASLTQASSQYDPYGGRTHFGESSFGNYGPSTTWAASSAQEAAQAEQDRLAQIARNRANADSYGTGSVPNAFSLGGSVVQPAATTSTRKPGFGTEPKTPVLDVTHLYQPFGYGLAGSMYA